MTTENQYALIGAGPMGLAMARNLQRFNIPFQGFELHSDVGGLWDIHGPKSTMYQSAHLISSKRMTEFDEFPMADHVADYPSHQEVGRYFKDFADRFELRPHYRFETEVVRVARRTDGGGWSVSFKKGSTPETQIFRGVLIANGTLSEPNRPSFVGAFDGEMLHSASYKDPAIFEGKRVLIVGAGNSGCDIAVDAVHRARRVAMSVRRGYHFVPKYVFGKPADAIGGKVKLPRRVKQKLDSFLLKWFNPDPQRLGFPKPDHALYESHPIVNSMVLYHAGHGDLSFKTDIERFDGLTAHFVDGTREDFDLVLLATGYKLHYPFISREELNWRGSSPQLYLNCFHPKRDDLFLLGMIEATGLGWQGRYEQAELVARFLHAVQEKDPKAERFRRVKEEPFPDMRGGWRYIQLDRMAYYVHKDTYRNTLRRHIRELS